MPKPLHHIDPILMHSLKMKLQSDMGVLVRNFTDCKRLSNQILLLRKERVSPSTLYRLFFARENNNHFYLSTLDLLVHTVYHNKTWNQFSEEYLESQSKLSFIGIHLQKQAVPSLLERCIEFNAWKPICQWFEDLSGDSHSMQNSLLLDNIGFHLRNVLEAHPEWEKKFYEKTAHFPFVKTSFFEIGTDPDFSLKNSALSFKYYRNALDPKSKLFENDSFYIDTLECLYLFKKKDSNAINFYNNIKSKYAHIQSLKNNIHIFNLSRFWILELHAFKFRNEPWKSFPWDSLVNRVERIFAQLDDFEQRITRFMILDACMYTGVPKTIIEMFLVVLKIQELPKFNETKLRYYLEQIDPNGTRWRKQFSHF